MITIIIIVIIIIRLYKCVVGFGRFRLLLHSGARTSLPLTRSVKEDLLEGVIRAQAISACRSCD